MAVACRSSSGDSFSRPNAVRADVKQWGPLVERVTQAAQAHYDSLKIVPLNPFVIRGLERVVLYDPAAKPQKIIVVFDTEEDAAPLAKGSEKTVDYGVSLDQRVWAVSKRELSRTFGEQKTPYLYLFQKELRVEELLAKSDGIVPLEFSLIEEDEAGQPKFGWSVHPFGEWGDLYDLYLSSHWKEMSADEKLSLFRDIAVGLEQMHRQNITHMDLKPDNVIIFEGERKRARITDFGLALGKGEPRVHLGCFETWSPEKILERRAELPSDMWALGLIAWRIFSNQMPPLDGMSRRSTLELLGDPHLFVSHGETFKQKALANGFKEDLINLILTLFEYDPKKRPTSAEFLKQLDLIVPPLEVIELAN